MIILDSSVYLAHLYKEKRGDSLPKLYKQCVKDGESIFIHQVNFLEIVYKVKSRRPNLDLTKFLSEFSSPWWGKLNYMDPDLMLIVADLKNKFQHASLADCIGLAATKIFDATFWTTDKLLADIGKAENITVQLIR